MKIEVIVNNYQIGAMVPITPTDKIIERSKPDRYHTKLVYDNITEKEKEFIVKVLHKKITILD